MGLCHEMNISFEGPKSQVSTYCMEYFRHAPMVFKFFWVPCYGENINFNCFCFYENTYYIILKILTETLFRKPPVILIRNNLQNY
jgi:hypothetical protein